MVSNPLSCPGNQLLFFACAEVVPPQGLVGTSADSDCIHQLIITASLIAAAGRWLALRLIPINADLSTLTIPSGDTQFRTISHDLTMTQRFLTTTCLWSRLLLCHGHLGLKVR